MFWNTLYLSVPNYTVKLWKRPGRRENFKQIYVQVPFPSALIIFIFLFI